MLNLGFDKLVYTNIVARPWQAYSMNIIGIVTQLSDSSWSFSDNEGTILVADYILEKLTYRVASRKP